MKNTAPTRATAYCRNQTVGGFMLSDKQNQCIERACKVLERLESRLGNRPTYIRAGSDMNAILDNIFLQAENNLREAFRKELKVKKGTRLPDDWELPLEWRKYASGRGLSDQDINDIAEDFKGWWCSKTGRDAMKANWELTWQGWVRREAKKRPKSETVSVSTELDDLGKEVCAMFPSIGHNYWMTWMRDVKVEEFMDTVTLKFKSKFMKDRVDNDIAHKLESYFGKSVILELENVQA